MVHGMAHQRMRSELAKQGCTLRQPQVMFEASSVVILAFGAQEHCLDNRDGMHATAACAT